MAGGKSNAWAADVIKLVLNATPIANIADNAASSPLTNLYVSLHTSDPGVGGSQTTNEAAYTSYARTPIARSNGSPAWTITGESASPSATIVFAAATGGTETETWFGIGTLISGAGVLLYRGTITPNISVSNGVTPQLTTATAVTEA